jgi:hypothetical protein
MGTSLAFLGLGAAGVAMQSYSSYEQAKAANQAAEWNAGIMEQNALNKDTLAEDALSRGVSAAAIQQIAARQARGEMRANYGASGVDVNSGSAADVVADRAAWDEYERQQVVANSEREAWGHRMEADNLRQQAAMTRNTKQSPWLAAGTTALSGSTSLWHQYSTYPLKK